MPKDMSYTEELAQEIIELIPVKPMYRICQMDHMPSLKTLHKWYSEHPEFHAKCRAMRDLCADDEFERHNLTIDEVRSGEIEPEVGAVILKAQQWRIAQLDKQRYGDKPAKLTITNNTDNRRVDVTFEALKLAPPDVLAAAKRQVIDAHQTPDKHLVTNGDDE